MLKNLKGAAAAAAVAGLLMLTGASSANGSATLANGGTFHGSSGAMRWIFTGGLGPLNCATSEAYFTAANGTYTGTTQAPAAVGGFVPVLANCVGWLNLAFVWNCGSPADDATSATRLNLIGAPSSGVTPVSITGISCTITLTLTGCQAVVQGSIEGSYANPNGSVNGTLTVQTANQNLAVVSSGCTSIIPVSSVNIGAPVGSATGLGGLTYELTTAGPTIA